MVAEAPTSWGRALLRFWLLKHVTVPVRSTTMALLAFGTTWLALWCAIDWSERQPNPVFSADGVPLLAWYVLGVLGLAALLRRLATPRPAPDHTLVLTLGLVPVPLLLVTLGADWLEPRLYWSAAGVACLYAFFYLRQGLRSLTSRPQGAAATLGVLGIVGFVALSDVTNAIPDVWMPRDPPPASSDADPAARETALFEQAGRIDQALDAVHRDALPHAEGFFLGFAGVGDEKVFAQEIGLASRVLGERYHIGGRQLSLVNDERDLDAAPLASVSALDYALHGLAAHMQLDRDILFLAISSHGSPDPSIAVSNSNLPFVDLTPQELADALRDAGIEWRVIFISACYAGGFIEPLRNPQTIVITAAAADRTSFGCSNDSDLTYFGEAFYRDALPDARSLQEAFEAARGAIAAREAAEGETPSNPKAYFGKALIAHLAELGDQAAAPH